MYIHQIIPLSNDRPYPILQFKNLKVAQHSTRGTTQLEDDTEKENPNQRPYVVEKWSYRNYTNKLITVCDRTGIALEIPPEARSQRRNLTIKRHFILRQPSHDSLIRLMNSRLEFNSAEMTLLKESIDKLKINYYNECEFVIEYNITPEDLEEYKGRFYHYQTDKVYFIGESHDCPIHPYSSDQVDLNAFIGTNQQETSQIQIKLEYVSNNVRAKPYWIKIFDKILPLVPHIAAPYKSIIIGRTRKTINDLSEYIRIYQTSFRITGEPFIDVQTLSIDEAKDRLRICETEELAKKLPTEEELKEQKILSLKHSIEEQKLELQRQKEVFAIEADKRQHQAFTLGKEVDLLKHNLELEKIAAQAAKAVIEKNAHDAALELQKSRQQQLELEAQLKQAELVAKQHDLDQKMKHEQLQRDIELRHARELELRKQSEYASSRAHEQELEELKKESIRVKNKYDKKSAKRKDRSEALKLIPSILIGLSAVIGFFVGKKRN